MTVEIYIPDSHSLKQRRTVVKSLKQRLRNRFNVTVTEYGNSELWQRAFLLIAQAGNNRTHLLECMQQVENFLDADLLGKADMIRCQSEFC